MPITHFLSEPTLRFFMFVLLEKGISNTPRHWRNATAEDTTNWKGPFHAPNIANDMTEFKTLIQDLVDLGVTDAVRILYVLQGPLCGRQICDIPHFQKNYDLQYMSLKNVFLFATDWKFLKKKWEEYINAFEIDALSSIQNYLPFSYHEEKIFEIFSQRYSDYHKQTFSIGGELDGYRYVEFLWVLWKQGICLINDIQCQDERVLKRTGMPVGNILNITLTCEGMKKLQDFMKEQAKRKKKENAMEKIWKSQETRDDFVFNTRGKEVYYKGVLVSFKGCRLSYPLLDLLTKHKEGVPLDVVAKELGYPMKGTKISNVGNDMTESEKKVCTKIYGLKDTIREKLWAACKHQNVFVDFDISIENRVVKITSSSI